MKIMVEKLQQDMIAAMKSHEKEKLTVIRMVKAAIDQEHIDRKRELNDELLIDVVNKQIKMRKDSIAEFEKGNREDLIAKTQSEIDILQDYLPEQLDDSEVEQVIDEIFSLVQPTSQKDMGKVMKEATSRLKGKADMKMVSEKIKARLQ